LHNADSTYHTQGCKKREWFGGKYAGVQEVLNIEKDIGRL